LPVVSQAQNRAMHAAAEGRSTLGIPKRVGQEFVNASHGEKVAKLPVRAQAPKRDRKAEHMAKRKAAGQTYREVAGEFGTSKSTAHRKAAGQVLRQGYNRIGGA
jgi:hypothetical protein